MTDRVQLAASPTTTSVYLSESGREGWFVFESSDLSAFAAADTQQGIYVAPSSDTTGASGAWVRKFDGAIESTWFGVSASATATENSAFMAAALATVKARAVTGIGYASGGQELRMRAGDYDFAGSIAVDFAAHLTGDFVGMFSGGGTVFNFPVGSDGISLTKDVGCARVEGIQIRGASATPGSGKHGLKCRGKVIASRLYISGFERGIDCFGSFAGDGTNTNGSSFRDIACQGNIWGTWADGTDANNMLFQNVACITNALGGHMDSSFLGNIYVGGDISSNGGPNQSIYKNRCHVAGHVYVCMKGQETWCSTNAPTGVATSNQGWIYIGEGSANAAQPTWTTGQAWYFSAPFAMDPDNGNARSYFSAMYIEPDQNPSIMTWPGVYYAGFDTGTTLTTDGTTYSGQFRVGYGGSISTGDVNGRAISGSSGVYAGANNRYFSADSGGVAVGGGLDPGFSQNGEFYINAWGAGAYNTIHFKFAGAERGAIQYTTVDNQLSVYNNQVGGGLKIHNTSGVNYTPLKFENGAGSHFIEYERRAGNYLNSANTSWEFRFGSALSMGDGGLKIHSGDFRVGATTVFSSSGVLQAAAMPALNGDVTSAAGSLALTIPNDTVTYAKMQNVSATDKLLGRASAGAGDIEEITCTAAGRALIDDPDAAAQRATLGLATVASSGSASDLSSGTMVRPVATSGDLTTSGGKIGYATGAGGTVTQGTSKATGVTLNKICGEITMNAAALAANTAVTFTLTNSAIAAGDRIIVNHVSGGTFGAYLADARSAAGLATVMLRNVSAASLSEAVVLGFSVIKAVTA